jgi:hypothetical protein
MGQSNKNERWPNVLNGRLRLEALLQTFFNFQRRDTTEVRADERDQATKTVGAFNMSLCILTLIGNGSVTTHLKHL